MKQIRFSKFRNEDYNFEEGTPYVPVFIEFSWILNDYEALFGSIVEL